MKHTKRILILRPDNIGDCVLFSGTLKFYKKLYSDSEITLAVKKGSLSLFENCPYIDKLIDYKKLSYIKKSNKIITNRVLNKIRKLTIPIINSFKNKYDYIICPVRSVTKEMLWIIKHLTAIEKFGIAGCTNNIDANKQILKPQVFTKYMILDKNKIWQHELITNFEFVKFLGFKPENVNNIFPEFWISDKNKKSILEKIKDFNNEDYIVLAPYAFAKYRELSTEIYLMFIDKRINNIVLTGGKENISESYLFQELLCENGFKVINMVGKTDLNELTFLIKNSKLTITLETSTLHIAIGNNVPVKAIVGGGHWGRFFPWGNKENVQWMNKEMDCFQCNWKCKYDDYRCINNISY